MRLGPGTSFAEGRYRLKRRIGAGGMATVWLGEDRSLNRAVAIKVISDVLAADPDYVARFEREARVAARLSHPNLVPIYDLDTVDGRPVLIMEYVREPNLAKRINSRLPGRRIDVEALATQLLDAVAYIHEAGIIHRDIKPENVLVGRGGRYMLTDFGVAIPEGGTKITETGQVIGTGRYLAPEVRGGSAATAISDLYSCGVLLTEAGAESGSPSVRRLARSLSSPEPEERPHSATEALAILGREASARATRRLPVRARARARIESLGLLRSRDVRVRLSPITALVALVCVAFLVVVLANAFEGGGDEEEAAQPPAEGGGAPAQLLAPERAPLDAQLDGLQRVLDRAAGG